ncbi:heme o synthase [Salinibacter altiplanensis]|uniref:heme o synthase n=1 Tax=Salinibacter altiplanensis TaxID=1803181 RepID=UPI000C9EF088|nr:heme o synthase [Salinibacter altiplanensis]
MESPPDGSSDAPVAVTVAPSTADAQASERSLRAVLQDYLTMAKPEISSVVTLSAFAGFLIGSPAGLDASVLFWSMLGTALCAGGVGMLNHVLERRYDAQMKRTAQRPLPADRANPDMARRVGILLICLAVGLLGPLVNVLTAVLAALTAVLYLFVYTPLKRTTKWNTLVGTVPGALPALGGYTAATGHLGAGGWIAFGILATWQMPHFLSLAWMYRRDYARGDYAMLPVVEPDGDSTAAQMIGFAALLVPVSILPILTETAGWIYGTGVLPLGLWFLWTTVVFHGERTGQQARRVLKASVLYIPVLVALLLVDWIL